jgi:DNA mismatch endonuclease (patch repair protein)
VEFWRAKFASNVTRDRRAMRKLKQMDWALLTVWECELEKPEKLTERLNQFLSKSKLQKLRPLSSSLLLCRSSPTLRADRQRRLSNGSEKVPGSFPTS